MILLLILGFLGDVRGDDTYTLTLAFQRIHCDECKREAEATCKRLPGFVAVTFAETAEASFEIGHHHGIAVGNWVEGGYTYVVVGALAEDGLRRIATEVGDRMHGI